MALAASARHTCALTTASDAYCWGSNTNGELGDGTQTARTAPVAVTGGVKFAAIEAGGGSVMVFGSGIGNVTLPYTLTRPRRSPET